MTLIVKLFQTRASFFLLYYFFQCLSLVLNPYIKISYQLNKQFVLELSIKYLRTLMS